MDTVALDPEILRRLEAQARRTAPEECCGVLLGRLAEAARTATVEAIVEADNAAEGDRRRRYSIPPELLLRLHREARDGGAEVVGYYHSHPDAPARPSEVDREHAFPGPCYLIVSPTADAGAEITAWRLDDERRFHPLTVSTPIP